MINTYGERDFSQKILSFRDWSCFSTALKTTTTTTTKILNWARFNLFEISLVINSSENIGSITKETVEFIPITNYEEADIRLAFHARMSNEASFIVARDTYVSLLLIYT